MSQGRSTPAVFYYSVAIGSLVYSYLSYLEHDRSDTLLFLILGIGALYLSTQVKHYIECKACLQSIPPSNTKCPRCGRDPRLPLTQDLKSAQPSFSSHQIPTLPVVPWHQRPWLVASSTALLMTLGFSYLGYAFFFEVGDKGKKLRDLEAAMTAVDYSVFEEYWSKNQNNLNSSSFAIKEKLSFLNPLCIASALGKKSIVEYLLLQGVDPNKESYFFGESCTPIFVAVKKGYVDIIQVLLSSGVKLDAKDLSGNSLAHAAVISGYPEILEEVHSRGLSINLTNLRNQTPLHLAVLFGRSQMIQLLKKKGADLSAKDKNGYTPLDLARKQKRNDLAGLLEAP